jgi:serine protease Do
VANNYFINGRLIMNKKRNILKVLLTAGLIVALVLVTACTKAATQPSSSASESLLTNFVNAVQKVLPSVVKVEVVYGPQGAPGDPSASAGAGSGWVIEKSGLIVTNNHVVAGAQTISIVMSDGTKYTPNAVQTNSGKDLAVLKIDAQNLTVVSTGDSSQLKLGQPVAALGNALNLGIRITTGVVSQLNVAANYDSVSLAGLIETDSGIEPGNSGGVLINVLGEVVGITNAGLQDQNLDVENFGYAITINEAMPVINNLISQMP